MGKRAWWIVFAVVTAACSGGNKVSTPTPAPTTFTLSGQVTDLSTSRGVTASTLSIVDGINAGKTAITDASGNFTFSGLQTSGFTLSVSANGYLAQSKGVTVTSTTTTSFQRFR